ncbi:hypothetical protein ACA910_013995 [Epithemia clementina (nom. ined.)]
MEQKEEGVKTEEGTSYASQGATTDDAAPVGPLSATKTSVMEDRGGQDEEPIQDNNDNVPRSSADVNNPSSLAGGGSDEANRPHGTGNNCCEECCQCCWALLCCLCCCE